MSVATEGELTQQIANAVRAAFTTPQQHRLLDWLLAPASPKSFMEWFAGDVEAGPRIARSPSESADSVLLAALPDVREPLEFPVRMALAGRVAELFEWMSTQVDSWTQSSPDPDVMFDLFELAQRLPLGPEHQSAVQAIRTSLDKFLSQTPTQSDGQPHPFSTEAGSLFRLPLTKVVAATQKNNDLEARWVHLIKNSAEDDPTLDASEQTLEANVLDAFRGLMHMPRTVKLHVFESCLDAFYTGLNRKVGASDICRDRAAYFLDIVDKQFPNYSFSIRFINYRLKKKSHSWLPELPSIYDKVHQINDPVYVARAAIVAETTKNLDAPVYWIRYESLVFPQGIRPKPLELFKENVYKLGRTTNGDSLSMQLSPALKDLEASYPSSQAQDLITIGGEACRIFFAAATNQWGDSRWAQWAHAKLQPLYEWLPRPYKLLESICLGDLGLLFNYEKMTDPSKRGLLPKLVTDRHQLLLPKMPSRQNELRLVRGRPLTLETFSILPPNDYTHRVSIDNYLKANREAIDVS